MINITKPRRGGSLWTDPSAPMALPGLYLLGCISSALYFLSGEESRLSLEVSCSQVYFHELPPFSFIPSSNLLLCFQESPPKGRPAFNFFSYLGSTLGEIKTMKISSSVYLIYFSSSFSSIHKTTQRSTEYLPRR